MQSDTGKWYVRCPGDSYQVLLEFGSAPGLQVLQMLRAAQRGAGD
jgi:hypothetical protein